MILVWRLRVAVLVASLAALPPAYAQAPVVQAEGETRSIACDGGAASIGGGRNTITFTGACTGLQIRGEANNVTVSLTPGALIDIEGNGNRVHFSSASPPQLRVSGNLTEVTPAPGSAAPAADTARLSGNNLTLELDCGAKSVTLQGTRSNFRLRGACAALTVRGEANNVHADLAPGAALLVEGNGISLVYTVANNGAAPQESVKGMGSKVVREGAQPLVQASPVAMPTGVSASVPSLMHDLDGVVVRAGTLVKLPPAVFNGATITPAGETQLSRLAALISQINPSGLRLTGQGPDAAMATQRAELVRDWLASHGAVKLPAKTGRGPGPTGVDVLILR